MCTLRKVCVSQRANRVSLCGTFLNLWNGYIVGYNKSIIYFHLKGYGFQKNVIFEKENVIDLIQRKNSQCKIKIKAH